MSVRVMAEVFARYPNGGGEMLLALALADHANDDGKSIRPSVEALAEKTRQSRRTVQRQLRAMEAAGWLVKSAHNDGGRSRTNRYEINPEWIKGDKLTPPIKGDIDDTKGRHSRQERATSATQKGDTGDTRKEPSGTINEPSGNHAQARDPAPKPAAITKPDDVDEQTWHDWLALRKEKRAAVTATVVTGAKREADKAGMTLNDFLTEWCLRGSQGLKASWLDGPRNSTRESFKERDERIARERYSALTGGLIGGDYLRLGDESVERKSN